MRLPRILFLMAFIVGIQAKSPELQFLVLKPSTSSDTTGHSSLRKTTLDSARIISPKQYSVIRIDSIPFEIEPLTPVDSVELFVRYSNNELKTFGIFRKAPYKAVWKDINIPDQDQIHLQFGYTLFCKSGLVINSSPTPHTWVFQQKNVNSRKRYSLRETRQKDTIKVDGDVSDWKGGKEAKIGEKARFKLLWTSAKLYFFIDVKDSSVSTGDFTELHIDLHQDRAAFSGINHRSIRFGPKSRSNAFVVDLTDSGFVLSDSVNVRISREMEWKAKVRSDGYTIEAMIPFCVLSDLEFPPAKFGLDVSIMDFEGQGKSHFYSWAGAEQYSRYSPSRWGTASLSQAFLALKLTFILLGAVILLVIVALVIYSIVMKRKEDKLEEMESRPVSQLTQAAVAHIEENLGNPEYNLEQMIKSLGKAEGEVVSIFEKDLDCSFDQYLTFRRIKRSQKLMSDPELSLGQIAKSCGFASYEVFETQYKKQMKTSPEISRKALLEEIREEQEEEGEEEEV